MTQAKQDAIGARSNAQDAFNVAWYARNQSDKLSTELTDVGDRIWAFLKEEQTTPAEVKAQAERALNKSINSNPDEITNLAQNISAIVGSLTDSESILADTAEDLRLAKNLLERANATKNEAIAKQNQGEKIVGLLDDAQTAQDKAVESIDTAKEDISSSQIHLRSIVQEMKIAQSTAANITAKVNILDGRLQQLQTQLVKNQYILDNDITDQAEDVVQEAEAVSNKTTKLRQEYRQAKNSLDRRINKSKGDIEKAKSLLQRASELTSSTSTKFKDLDGMETVYRDNERKLADLMAVVDSLTNEMTIHLAEIDAKAMTYRQCST